MSAKESSFSLQFGTTLKTMIETFNNVKTILSIILEEKLNDNFFDIFNEVKPIEDIDEYMSDFNFNKVIAVQHNEELTFELNFWLFDAKKNTNESKVVLNRLSKVEDYVNFVAKNETIFHSFLNKTLRFLRIDDISQISVSSQQSDTSLLELTESESKIGSSLKELKTDVETEVKLIVKVNAEQKSFTLSKALEEIQKRKDIFCNHLFAAQTLQYSIEALIAINDSNKREITKWKLNENALKIRDNLISKRKKVNRHKHKMIAQNIEKTNSKIDDKKKSSPSKDN